MRIVDDALLAEFRAAWRCEVCGKPTPSGCDPMHCFSRGAGRLDIRQNLLAGCRSCHQANPDGRKLLAIVAKREGTTVEAIKALVYRLRRTRR